MTLRHAVFISFRHSDGGEAAAHLDSALTEVLGADNVFLSGRVIPAGSDFPAVLRDAVAKTCVMLVVIGRTWLSDRLHEPDDWVRYEVAEGLRAGIPVIPVLLTDAKLPRRADLPDDLADLSARQETHFRRGHIPLDLGHLVAALHEVAPELALRHLIRPWTSTPPVALPSALLRPGYEIVPFTGRSSELAELSGWLDGEQPVDMLLVTGPAGQGKSRLAQELCRRAAEDGWAAGFLPGPDAAPALSRLGGVGIRLLVVADYAEGSVGQVADLLAALVDRPADAARARVLLLARADGPWLDDLWEHPDDRVAATAAGMRIHRLRARSGPGYDPETDFREAAAAFADRLGLDAHTLTPPTGVPGHDRALDAHAFALAALLDTASPGGDPVLRLLHHERRYWRDTVAAWELPDPHRARLDAVTAAATAFGGDLDALLPALPTFTGQPPDVARRYGRWLTSVYPSGETAESPALRPDRLGEDHVAAVLLGQPGLVPALAGTLTDAQVTRGLSTLTRAAQRHRGLASHLSAIVRAAPPERVPLAVEVALQQAEPGELNAAIAEVVTGADDPAALAALVARRVPAHLPAYAGLHELVSDLVLAGTPDDKLMDDLLRGRAVRLAAEGSFEAAFQASGESVLHSGRMLAKKTRAWLTPRNDEVFRLIFSLAVHADIAAAAGHEDEALTTITHVAALLQALSPIEAEGWLPSDETSHYGAAALIGDLTAVDESARLFALTAGSLRIFVRLLEAAGRTDEAAAARFRLRQVEHRQTAATAMEIRLPVMDDQRVTAGPELDQVRERIAENIRRAFRHFPDQQGG